MDVNQVVGPIKAPNGLHLIKLLEIHGSPLQSGKLTKDQAHEIVFQNKLVEKIKPWLKELRETAYIKIN
jgi:parvulin-like peptidyl-prolyl isomerase